jgi:hypothetical protein
MINCVESQYTQEYIANVFWRQHIAKVSSITLIPYLKNGEVCSIAYVYIDQWCDSEAAYNFIQRLNNPSNEARIVHHDDNWWPVQINTHNNGDIYVGFYTTAFPSSYFVRDLDDDESTVPCTEVDDDESTVPCTEVDDEEWCEFDPEHPIQGLGDDRYTVEEAEAHLSLLKADLATAYRRRVPDEALEELESEIANFEAELRIHEAVKNSQNVTLREKQQPRWALVHPEDNTNGGRREVACSNMW